MNWYIDDIHSGRVFDIFGECGPACNARPFASAPWVARTLPKQQCRNPYARWIGKPKNGVVLVHYKGEAFPSVYMSDAVTPCPGESCFSFVGCFVSCYFFSSPLVSCVKSWLHTIFVYDFDWINGGRRMGLVRCVRTSQHRSIPFARVVKLIKWNANQLPISTVEYYFEIESRETSKSSRGALRRMQSKIVSRRERGDGRGNRNWLLMWINCVWPGGGAPQTKKRWELHLTSWFIKEKTRRKEKKTIRPKWNERNGDYGGAR